MKGDWKPISEYPTNVLDPGPIVLARDKEKNVYLVILNKGHFYPCPGVPMFYGDHQFGFMTCDHVVEFMELPQ